MLPRPVRYSLIRLIPVFSVPDANLQGQRLIMVSANAVWGYGKEVRSEFPRHCQIAD